ncbi:MAG: T9SS type A sorting domain-containing protein [Bacteroidales bacterium]|nr:T9SS type A sorting domain-containing protein [Bacteroidales bacterium]
MRKHLSLLLFLIFGGNILHAQTYSTEKIISNSGFADWPNDILAVDFDLDGDIDLMTVTENNDRIIWFENNGNMEFTGNIIKENVHGPRNIQCVDMDLDGDLDILTANCSDDEVAWYKNDSTGNYPKITISGNTDGIECVYAADIDNDGDWDVVTASFNDDKVAWFENDSLNTYFTEHIISSTMDGAAGLSVVDLDEDLDLDIIATGFNDDTVTWYENDGSENFTAHLVANYLYMAHAVYAIDMDLDTDLDIILAALGSSEIVWLENDGNENFSYPQPIITLTNLDDMYPVDIDGDNDIDVLATNYDGKYNLYINNGHQNFSLKNISSDGNMNCTVKGGDMDNDKDIDIIMCSSENDKIAWYENYNGSKIDTTICNGDTIFLFDTNLHIANSYNFYVPSSYGTDSLVTVRLSTKECTGIYLSNTGSILICPNPFSDYIQININEDMGSDIIATIFNSSGKVVLQFILEEKNNYTINNLSTLSNGIYLLNIRSHQGWTKNIKIIKNK